MHKLPQEILAKLVKTLEPAAIHSLHATCNLFSQVLSGPPHQSEPHKRTMISIWLRASHHQGEDTRMDSSYDCSCERHQEFRASPGFYEVISEFLHRIRWCEGVRKSTRVSIFL